MISTPSIAALQPAIPLPSIEDISVPSLPAVANGATNGQNVDAVSTDFEAVFLSQMMTHMFEGDEFGSYFGDGTAGDVYKSYLLNEYGKMIAKTGGIGIAAMVKKKLLELQEVHQ